MRRHLLVLEVIPPLVNTEGLRGLHAADGMINRRMVWTHGGRGQFSLRLRALGVQQRRSPDGAGYVVLLAARGRVIAAMVAALWDDGSSLMLQIHRARFGCTVVWKASIRAGFNLGLLGARGRRVCVASCGVTRAGRFGWEDPVTVCRTVAVPAVHGHPLPSVVWSSKGLGGKTSCYCRFQCRTFYSTPLLCLYFLS